MPVLEIEGKQVEVDESFLRLTPEQQNATVDEIARSMGISALPQQEQPQQKAPIRQAPKADEGGFLRDVDSFMRGAADTATFGLADEISGLGSAVVQSLNPFRDNSKGFPSVSENIEREREIQRQRDAADPISSTTGRVAGGLMSAGGAMRAGLSPTANLAANASLKARMAAGAAEGAAYGGLYGLGSGEGLSDRVSQGLGGAGAGAVIGGAVPAVAAVVKTAAKPLIDNVRARMNPGGYAAEKVVERLAASGKTPGGAVNRMMSNPGSSLADIGGKSTRTLLRTATNIPGAAKDRVNSQLTVRQFGQGDRLKASITKTFADPDGYLAAKDQIAETAKRAAAPLYKQAYETPVLFSKELEGILRTPAGQSALRQAEILAGNEQVPFRQLFVNIADDGTATARRVPDARAWDYIKRAMDDMIDSQTDSLTRKVSNEGRILVNLKNRMLEEIDKYNPAYKQARSVWAGQAQLDDALETGRKVFTLSPEALRREVAGMSEAQKAAARIGAADALRQQIDNAGITHNAVLRIFSKPSQQKNLRALFGSSEQFAEFRKAIFAEARKRATYEAIKGNSTTTSELADLMEAGGLKEGLDVVKNAATGGVMNATLSFIGSRLRMLGGLTPDVADEIAKRLMTTNPQAVQNLSRELAAIEQASLSAAQRSNAVRSLVTRALQAPTQQMASQPQ